MIPSVSNMSTNWNSNILLVGVWNGKPLWKTLWQFLSYIYTFCMDSLIPLLGVYQPPHPKKENICSQKDLYMNVDGKFTQNSPNLKITQMSTNRYIDTQIRKYSYARLQLNNKKKQTNDTWGKMDESPNHQPAWKKLGRKEYILYDSILEWPNGWPCCWWKGDSLQKRLVGVIGMPYILSVNILGLHTVKVRRLHWLLQRVDALSLEVCLFIH